MAALGYLQAASRNGIQNLEYDAEGLEKLE
jgi:hypothetical protein